MNFVSFIFSLYQTTYYNLTKYSNAQINIYFFFHREDMYAQDSIDLLQNSGLQFVRHQDEGIDPVVFAELLMTSGVVIMEDVRFLSFHR